MTLKKFLAGLSVLFLLTPILTAQTYRLVSKTSLSPGYPYTTWDTAGHSIQTVINASDPGDIIYVYDGTYVENITVNKDITLESWCRDPGACVIYGMDGLSPTVTISDPTPSSGVISIHGFTIQGGSKGVYITGNESGTGDYPVISGCIIEGHSGSYGVHGYHAKFTVEFCTLVNNNEGVFADYCFGGTWIRYCIFDHNATAGAHAGNSTYVSMKNNCFHENGQHLIGFSSPAICDEWGLPAGVDPMFVDYSGGDYHLAAGSPCIDFDPDDYGYPQCRDSYYDINETPADIGAYGGAGEPPSNPTIDTSTLQPASGAYHVDHSADVSFKIEDYPAGLNLDSLVITISDHGYPAEQFHAGDCSISECEYFGAAPGECLGICYNVTLPGSAHQPFVDFAYVRVTVHVEDNSPTPNSMTYSWRFHADDLTPPVMLSDHYPANGDTDIPLYGPVEIGFVDTPGIGVRHSSLHLEINGVPVSMSESGVSWIGDRVTVYPNIHFDEATTNTITVRIADYYYNWMSDQTITFSTLADLDKPFVPGVTAVTPTPSASYDVPTPGPDPQPEPDAVDVDPVQPVTFSVQDYQSSVELDNMIVTISNSTDSWIYTLDGSGVGEVAFSVDGNSFCPRITCDPPGKGSWGEYETVTVDITGAVDSSAAHNAQDPAQYSFQTTAYRLPTLTPYGFVLLLGFLGFLLKKKRH